MDVRQWLETAVDRDAPDPNEDRYLPDHLQRRGEPEPAVRKYRSKRKRASSDSPIIAPRRDGHDNRRAISTNPVLKADRSARSRGPQSSRAAEDDRPAKTYERRARHKTRHDRYDAKLKTRKKDRDVCSEDVASKPKRRKSQRSGGDGERTAGLVRNFQLKNGPKSNRLTLKPDRATGIFKHGRASMQVAARGNGLPDLVFNEMKFLQKPKEHQDEVLPGAGQDESQPRKDRARRREENISAYFAANKEPAIACLEPQSRSKESHNLKPHRPTSGHDAHREDGSRQPSIGPILPPFLGFGSRGPQPESKEHPTSNSYFTWSQSDAYDSARPLQDPLQQAPAEKEERLTRRVKHRRSETENRAVPAIQSDEHRPLRRPSIRDDQGSWIQSRQARGPTLVEGFQPPATADEEPPRRHSSVTRTTLQSLPQHPSSAHGHSEHGALRGDYRTSDILMVQHSPPVPSETHPAQHRGYSDDRNVAEDKENRATNTSTPTSRLLRRAHEVTVVPEVFERCQISVEKPRLIDFVGSPLQQSAGLKGQHEQYLRAARSRNRHAAHCSRLSSYEPKINQQQRTEIAYQRRPPSADLAAVYDVDGDEILDNFVDRTPQPFGGAALRPNRRGKEFKVDQIQFVGLGLYQAQEDPSEPKLEPHVSSYALRSEHSADNALPHSDRPILDDVNSEYPHDISGEQPRFCSGFLGPVQDVVTDIVAPRQPNADDDDDDDDDEFAGFWKPQRLY